MSGYFIIRRSAICFGVMPLTDLYNMFYSLSLCPDTGSTILNEIQFVCFL